MKVTLLTFIDYKRITQRLSTELPWACGPPIEMKVPCYGSLIPNRLPATFEGVLSLISKTIVPNYQIKGIRALVRRLYSEYAEKVFARRRSSICDLK
jgi:hypothetical protein